MFKPTKIECKAIQQWCIHDIIHIHGKGGGIRFQRKSKLIKSVYFFHQIASYSLGLEALVGIKTMLKIKSINHIPNSNSRYIQQVGEGAKKSPELIQLLELHTQFATVTPYSQVFIIGWNGLHGVKSRVNKRYKIIWPFWL